MLFRMTTRLKKDALQTGGQRCLLSTYRFIEVCILPGPRSIFGVHTLDMLQPTISPKEDINLLLVESDEETYGCSTD